MCIAHHQMTLIFRSMAGIEKVSIGRALVRSLFCIVESPEKNDRWFMRESKPGHREWKYNATSGRTAGVIGGQFAGAYRL